MSYARGMCNKIISFSLGIILFACYVARCHGVETQIGRRAIGTVIRESNWNKRLTRDAPNSTQNNDLEISRGSAPSFGDFERNIIVQEGQVAILHCVVNDLGIGVVDWFRKESGETWDELASGLNLIENDGRFDVYHADISNDWVLRIRNTHFSDGGVYECRAANMFGGRYARITLNVMQTQIERRAIGTVIRESNWNKRLTRDAPNSTQNNDLEISRGLAPSFGDFERNITVQEGQVAILHCVVNDLGKGVVYWYKKENGRWRPLALGLRLLVRDWRLDVYHADYANDWVLRIRNTDLSDGGDYDCIASNKFGAREAYITLNIMRMRTVILQPPKVYVEEGSTIDLTCIVTGALETPTEPFWHQNNHRWMLKERGECTLRKFGHHSYITKLKVKDAIVSDTGKYSCGILYNTDDFIFVIVVNDTTIEPYLNI